MSDNDKITDMLNDDTLFLSFIEECEKSLHNAPPDFTQAVMNGIAALPSTSKLSLVTIKRMCAAACFCGAAAVALFTFYGIDSHISDIVLRASVNLTGFIRMITPF